MRFSSGHLGVVLEVNKILIASIATFLQPSGAVRVALTVLDQLQQGNYDVSFAALHSPDLRRMSTKFFKRGLQDRFPVYQLYCQPRRITMYHRLLIFLPIMKAIETEDPSIVFIDHSSYRPLRRHLRGRKLIQYVHFPPLSRLIKLFPDIYEESLTTEFKRFPLNIYWDTYMLLEKFVAIDENFADVICANSRFTAEVANKIWNRYAEIIYPPVTVKDFVCLQKQNTVASIGRIDPDKRFEDLIKAISLCDAKPMLEIVGSITSANSPYLTKLRGLVRELNLNGRVNIQLNATFDAVRQTLGKSKVYVHTKHYEHFGMTVVEAMASGCVPVVHRSGGPYLDIIDKDRYGSSFRTVEELAKKIDALLTSDISNLSERSINRSKDFGEDVFRKKIMHVIEN